MTVILDDLAPGLPFTAARGEGRILMTLDKGIANQVRYPSHTHSGVVLFRPRTSGRLEVLRFIEARLRELLAHDLADRVTIVSEQRIRVR